MSYFQSYKCGLFVLFLFAIQATTASPTTLYVSPTGNSSLCDQTEPCSLSEAINLISSDDGGTIEMLDGHYLNQSVHLDVIPKILTLSASNSTDVYWISSVLNFTSDNNNVSLTTIGINFQDFDYNVQLGSSNGIYFSRCKWTQSNVNIVVDNLYDQIQWNNVETVHNSMVIMNVTFQPENCCDPWIAIAIDNSLFLDNTQLTITSLFHINNAIFSHNYNGLLMNMPNALQWKSIISDSQYSFNSPITVSGSNFLEIQNTLFQGNNGGTILINGGMLEIDNCTFLNNKCLASSSLLDSTTNCFGGAIFGNSASIFVSNSRFNDNCANIGGAIAIVNSSILVIESSTFANNVATVVGAVFNIQQSQIFQLSWSTINSSTCQTECCGSIVTDSETWIQDSIFYNNAKPVISSTVNRNNVQSTPTFVYQGNRGFETDDFIINSDGSYLVQHCIT